MLPEFAERDIALAAIRLAHLANGAIIDEKEIPDASARMARTGGGETKGRYDAGGNDRWSNDGPRKRPPNKGGSGEWIERPRGGKAGEPFEKNAGSGSGERFAGAVAKLYFGLGHKDGVRAGDLVGSIANENSLSGRDIGPIRISEHFSVVGIPEAMAEAVIQTMRKTTLKGKKVTVRRFVDEPRG